MRTTPEGTQKAYERRQAERFLEAAGLGSAWMLGDSERPDFLLTDGQQRIGLEVSDLFWDALPPRQPGEARRERVCDDAHRCWNSAGGPHVDVRIEFDPSQAIRRREAAHVARSLVNVARSNLPQPGGFADVETRSTPSLPPHCQAVRIAQLIGSQRSYWYASGGDWLPDLTPSRVQRRLDAKETRLPWYRLDVEEHWLLLIVNPFELSTVFEIPCETKRAVYRTSFDRLVVLSVQSGELIEPVVSTSTSSFSTPSP